MKNYLKICCITLLVISNLLSTPNTFADNSINTVTITQQTLQAMPSCLHYQVVGMCFWLVCGFGCDVVTTPKVDHYLPDVVITAYSKFQHDPWTEINDGIDQADHAAGSQAFAATDHGMSMSDGSISSENNSHNDIQFREVNVIGNPALFALHIFHLAPLLYGQATSYVPYYQSQLDATAWRSGLTEQLYPDSWVPGKAEVGTFLLDDWGSVYPRQGFIVQPNIGKASAVVVVRGGSIATTDSYNHLSVNLNGQPCQDADCTVPGEILSDTPKTKWQPLLPISQNSCDDKINDESMENDESNVDQAFAWIVWREYRGCLDGGGQFLGSVG